MKDWIKGWLVGVVINYALKQIEQLGKKINWTEFKVDTARKVADLIPGKMFDEPFVHLTHVVCDAIARALGNKEDWGQLMKALADEDWDRATAEIREIVTEAWEKEEKDETQTLAFEAFKGAGGMAA
mgnify:CR=1 FL=1